MGGVRTALVCLTLTVAATAVPSVRAQPPEIRVRVDAYVRALSSGSPEQFEAMAREQFTPELLARTADQRRQMVERVHADFGDLAVAGEVITTPTHADLTMKGSKNDLPMTISIDLEAATPLRITQVSIRVGGPAGGTAGRGGPPPLPPPPVNGRMPAGELAGRLDGYLAELARTGDFAGVVLVARDGQQMCEKPYGVADRERHTPMASDLRFNLASIGKAFNDQIDLRANLLPQRQRGRARHRRFHIALDRDPARGQQQPEPI